MIYTFGHWIIDFPVGILYICYILANTKSDIYDTQ